MAANGMFRCVFVLAALGIALSGCRSSSPPSYRVWASEPARESIDSSSSNGFDLYCQAALDAERDGAKYLTRVSFYPDQRKLAATLVSNSFRKVIQGTGREVQFRFKPHRPFTTEEYHRGWRLLGRVFAWKVEDACKSGDFGTAVQLAIVGTRFGFDLTGGGAMDADLGLDIVDGVRRAIAPFISKMDAAHQRALGDGIKGSLNRLTPLQTIFGNEKQNMLFGVQIVQDAYQKNDLDSLSENLGPTVKEAVDYLKNVRKDDERRAYFEGFAAEAEVLTDYYQKLAAMPAVDRRSQPDPPLAKERPWRRFARHFFDTQPLIMQSYDSSLARTKLLVLSADLCSKKKQGLPHDLSGYPKELTADPYTGQRFLYHYDGAQFNLYSVGSNLKDDGGETDATFASPDLLLETGLGF